MDIYPGMFKCDSELLSLQLDAELEKGMSQQANGHVGIDSSEASTQAWFRMQFDVSEYYFLMDHPKLSIVVQV